MVEFRIRVAGIPAPKGSVSAFPIQRKSGKVGTVVVHSARSKSWETLVRDQLPEGVRLTGALEVKIIFFLPRPASIKRAYPSVRPDLSKLIRSTEDALKGAIDDDARIVDLDVKKRYVKADGFVGALIRVKEKDEML